MHQFGSAHRHKFEFPKGTISICMLGRGMEGKVDELRKTKVAVLVRRSRRFFSHSEPYIWGKGDPRPRQRCRGRAD